MLHSLPPILIYRELRPSELSLSTPASREALCSRGVAPAQPRQRHGEWGEAAGRTGPGSHPLPAG